MNFTVLKTSVSVSPLFFAVLTAFLLADKKGIASAVILFSFFHELGHFLALLCEKESAKSVKISAFGIEMALRERMSTEKKLAVLAAGFSVNFILAAIMFFFKKSVFGYINLLLGCLTAVPVASTDGGSMLKIILERFFSEKADKIFFRISFPITFSAAALIFAFAVYSKNPYLFLAVFYMFIAAFK